MIDDPELDSQIWRERAETAEKELAELMSATERKLVRAELRAAALQAGMVDLDGIALIDSGAIKLDDQGSLANATSLMGQLRRAKPWLFGGTSTSSGAGAPVAQPPRAKLATEMSVDEWRTARADLLKRR